LRRKPLLLISNDDGIGSRGINALAQSLKEIGEIVVVAPDRQQSAVGHAITVNTPLRASKFYRDGVFFGYAVTGTPADAVKLAVRSLLKRRPSILVSGINHGSNTAVSILYSGTVSAATEGTILGIPSVAISLATFKKPDFSFAARFAGRIVRLVLEHGLPNGVLLNVNVPPVPEEKIRGVKVTRQGEAVWDDTFDVRRGPNNKEYFWLTGNLIQADTSNDADEVAVRHRYVSITPIQFDLTAYTKMEDLRGWIEPAFATRMLDGRSGLEGGVTHCTERSREKTK